MKKGDRKARIEATVKHMQQYTHEHGAVAWARLRLNLDAMADPEARPPRFNALLRAIWSAATNEQS